MRIIAIVQGQSNPPPEGVKLNSLLAEMYGLLANGAAEASNGDFTNVQSYDAQYRALASQADLEDERVRQACL